jgi:hypothetical protein
MPATAARCGRAPASRRAAIRISAGSGHSPRQHGHVRRPMTTAAARPSSPEWSSPFRRRPLRLALRPPPCRRGRQHEAPDQISAQKCRIPRLQCRAWTNRPAGTRSRAGSPGITAIPRTRQRSRSPPARPHRAGTPASSARIWPKRSSAWPAWPRQTGHLRLPLPWPSWQTRSGLRIRSGHPAGERPVPAVVRWLVEHCLPELVVAAVAGDSYVSHAAAASDRLPGRFADARRPAHLSFARPQLVTERAAFWLVLEQRNGHLNDHARASHNASMITAAWSEPGPGGVGPGPMVRTGCADRGGGG